MLKFALTKNKKGLILLPLMALCVASFQSSNIYSFSPKDEKKADINPYAVKEIQISSTNISDRGSFKQVTRCINGSYFCSESFDLDLLVITEGGSEFVIKDSSSPYWSQISWKLVGAPNVGSIAQSTNSDYGGNKFTSAKFTAESVGYVTIEAGFAGKTNRIQANVIDSDKDAPNDMRIIMPDELEGWNEYHYSIELHYENPEFQNLASPGWIKSWYTHVDNIPINSPYNSLHFKTAPIKTVSIRNPLDINSPKSVNISYYFKGIEAKKTVSIVHAGKCTGKPTGISVEGPTHLLPAAYGFYTSSLNYANGCSEKLPEVSYNPFYAIQVTDPTLLKPGFYFYKGPRYASVIETTHISGEGELPKKAKLIFHYNEFTHEHDIEINQLHVE